MNWRDLLPSRRNRYGSTVLLDEHERQLSIQCLTRISYDTKDTARETFAPLRYRVMAGGKVLRTGRFHRRNVA